MSKKTADWLFTNIEKSNLAEDIAETVIGKITSRAMRGFDNDEDSREEWTKKAELGIKIAKQIMEHKTYPWDGAANVKFPMIATAAIQFAARAYPNIVNPPLLVKAQVIGADPDGQKLERAGRVTKHMSYQLMEGMPEWDEDTDKLLHGLPVFGTYFRKTYFDQNQGSNRSISINPFNLIINQKAKSIDTCRRVSEKIPLYRNDVIERERKGLFLDKGAEYFVSSLDDDDAEIFIEQHCWIDLDDDGYEEPYIITIHQESKTLVRIVARYDETGIEVDKKGRITRITPTQYYTKFDFIPDPEGMFMSLGFAHLLGPINESINTLINQLLDAGSINNLQSGFFGKGIRLSGGNMRFKPGEWKPVDVSGGVLRDNIFPLPTKDPSQVLFSLLGLLNDTGMKLASVSEAMTGETPSQNTPATTTLALIEQGMKVFTAIYKRVFRSLKSEFKKLYHLNSLYMNEQEYYQILDEENVAFQADYNVADLNIVPLADPNLSTDAQKLARAQAIIGTFEQNPVPEGKIAILKQYYTAIDPDNVDKLLPKEAIEKMLNAPAPPDPDFIKTQLLAVKQQHDYEMEKAQADADVAKTMAEIDQLKAQTKKILAEAASVPITTQLNALRDYVAVMHNETKMEIERIKANSTPKKEMNNEQGDQRGDVPGGTPGMAGAPDVPQDIQLPVGDPEGMAGGTDDGIDIESELSGENGPADLAALGQDIRSGYSPDPAAGIETKPPTVEE